MKTMIEWMHERNVKSQGIPSPRVLAYARGHTRDLDTKPSGKTTRNEFFVSEYEVDGLPLHSIRLGFGTRILRVDSALQNKCSNAVI